MAGRARRSSAAGRPPHAAGTVRSGPAAGRSVPAGLRAAARASRPRLRARRGRSGRATARRRRWTPGCRHRPSSRHVRSTPLRRTASAFQLSSASLLLLLRAPAARSSVRASASTASVTPRVVDGSWSLPPRRRRGPPQRAAASAPTLSPVSACGATTITGIRRPCSWSRRTASPASGDGRLTMTRSGGKASTRVRARWIEGHTSTADGCRPESRTRSTSAGAERLLRQQQHLHGHCPQREVPAADGGQTRHPGPRSFVHPSRSSCSRRTSLLPERWTGPCGRRRGPPRVPRRTSSARQ